ncbi:MAG: PrsW family glutamic-type intramembrane protease [bacterium]
MATSITVSTVFLSLVTGIIPPLFWLWFWMREDSVNPEPRNTIVATFIAGMFAIFPTFIVQQLISKVISYDYSLLILWPLTEEIAKYLSAYIVALRSKEYDEPMDAVIYLITAALGFSAAENFFFLVKPEFSLLSIITANMRFIGATNLHLFASAIVGVFLAFSFYKNKKIKTINLILGLLTATTLHSMFNLFIIRNKGENILIVFAILWLFTVGLLLVCEKIKNIKK